MILRPQTDHCVRTAPAQLRDGPRAGHRRVRPRGDVAIKEACYPDVEGKEPPPVSPEWIARLMAASARHGQTVLPPAHG